MENNNFWNQLIQFAIGIFSKGEEPAVSVTFQTDKPSPSALPEATPVYKISKSDLLMGRDKTYALEYTQQISDNLDRLLPLINKIRDAWAKDMKVDSGWRPPEVNASTPGAAAHSKHMDGLAVDIADPDGSLMAWVLQNLPMMKELGIYFEDFRWTPTWVHFQIGPPKSGHRIFVPNTQRAAAPEKWDGNYDHSFDTAA